MIPAASGADSETRSLPALRAPHNWRLRSVAPWDPRAFADGRQHCTRHAAASHPAGCEAAVAGQAAAAAWSLVLAPYRGVVAGGHAPAGYPLC